MKVFIIINLLKISFSVYVDMCNYKKEKNYYAN